MKKPILVVLAAGMGSRYGGLKQMDGLGAHGEVLLDYSVFDAMRSGFEKMVFIIRHDIEKDFRERVLARFGSKVKYELAFQEMGNLIPASLAAETKLRTKPWGTSHALLCAQDKIDAPFAVINADDFYGREAFAVMAEHLSQESRSRDGQGGLSQGDRVKGAIVPYKLEKTLSPKGTVTRGVCAVKDGKLVSVDELKAIAKEGGVIFNAAPDGVKQPLAPDTPVSMNFWGFPPTVFPHLARYFDDFLAASGKEPKSECYLPTFADWLIKNGLLGFDVVEADSEWFGVTYQEDRESAIKRIAELTAAGVYSARLW